MITVYYDVETGGTEPQHPTIQLAAIAVDGGKELGAFEQKIQFDEAACDPGLRRARRSARELQANDRGGMARTAN